jgi:hypothetical protein
MAQLRATKRKKLISKTILFGGLSLAMYGVFFMNSALMMSYFTKGLYYAALPILTVFAFSFVHGSFASNVWTLLGIEASQKRPAVRPTAQPRPVRRQRPRPRVHLNT